VKIQRNDNKTNIQFGDIMMQALVAEQLPKGNARPTGRRHIAGLSN